MISRTMGETHAKSGWFRNSGPDALSPNPLILRSSLAGWKAWLRPQPGAAFPSQQILSFGPPWCVSVEAVWFDKAVRSPVWNSSVHCPGSNTRPCRARRRIIAGSLGLRLMTNVRRFAAHIRILAPVEPGFVKKPRFIKQVYGAGVIAWNSGNSDPKQAIPAPALEPWPRALIRHCAIDDERLLLRVSNAQCVFRDWMHR